MIRQIKMDWRAMKCYQVRIFLLPVFAAAIGMYNPLLVIPTSAVMFLSFSINVFAVEEKGDLNRLYLTLPIPRSSIVMGRFIFSTAMGLAGILTGIPVMLLITPYAASQYYGPPVWYFSIIAVSLLLIAFLNLAMFPILFKLGYGKGKFWGFILPLAFISLLYGGYAVASGLPGNELLSFNLMEYAYKNLLAVSGGFILLSTVLLFTSYEISKKLYSRRDF